MLKCMVKMNKLKIVWVSNITLEPYLRNSLNELFQKEQIQVELTCYSYEKYLETGAGIDADYIGVYMDFDTLFPNATLDILSNQQLSEEYRSAIMSLFQKIYSTSKQHGECPLIWFGLEDYCFQSDWVFGTVPKMDGIVDQINLNLIQLLDEDVFIDMKRLIANVGVKVAYNPKGKYRWNAPYSKDVIEQITMEVYKAYLRNTGHTPKCLVLDCDNVLWGGILSEDGIEGIQLGDTGPGKAYQDFQRYLLELYYHGVILTVCSKNDKDDVLKVFKEHSGMVLKEENIALFRVNWDNKVDNIQYISDILNIGLDSMVFVDDSPFEIGAVSSAFSDVTTIIFRRDSIYKDLGCFNLKRNIDVESIRQRNQTYLTNVQRRELQDTSGTFEDYLKKLKMNIDIHEILASEIARVSELTQRANKCTNGIRYTVNELMIKIQNPNYSLWSISVSDRFANLGIVGAVGIYKNTLDLFVLSCRALGRGIEDKMMSLVNDQNVEFFSFLSTKKNEAIFDIFSKKYHLLKKDL